MRPLPPRWLGSLVLVATAAAQVGKDYYVFPSLVKMLDVNAPVPDLLPLTVNFKFTSASVGVSLLQCSDLSGLGIKLELDYQGRVFATVSTMQGTSATVSQQTNLHGESKSQQVRLVISAVRLQVQVNGTLGPSATMTAPSCGIADSCVFGWSERRSCTVGQKGYVGSISDFRVSRMTSSEEPRVTAADGSGEVGVSERNTVKEKGGDATAIRVVCILLVVLVLLVFIVLVARWRGYLPCIFGQSSSKTLVDVTADASPPTAVTPASMLPSPEAASPAKRPSSPTSTVAVSPAAPTPAVVGSKECVQAVVVKENLPSLETPAWWTGRRSVEKLELMQSSNRVRLAVQELMNTTWKSVVTKDRSKLAGSASVQHFEVVQVNRNENSRLFKDYAHKRRNIAHQVSEEDALTNVLTSQANYAELGAPAEGCNEFLLFHGSKPSSIGSIIESDFLLKLTGTRRGTLYGPGLYFAESSSKADEYAEDDKEGIYRGLYAMLLCRVTLGKSLYIDEPFPDGAKLKNACVGPGAQYHSVLGDREKACGTYREFVVFDPAQVYPEYVIIYRRSGDEG